MSSERELCYLLSLCDFRSLMSYVCNYRLKEKAFARERGNFTSKGNGLFSPTECKGRGRTRTLEDDRGCVSH